MPIDSVDSLDFGSFFQLGSVPIDSVDSLDFGSFFQLGSMPIDSVDFIILTHNAWMVLSCHFVGKALLQSCLGLCVFGVVDILPQEPGGIASEKIFSEKE